MKYWIYFIDFAIRFYFARFLTSKNEKIYVLKKYGNDHRLSNTRIMNHNLLLLM